MIAPHRRFSSESQYAHASHQSTLRTGVFMPPAGFGVAANDAPPFFHLHCAGNVTDLVGSLNTTVPGLAASASASESESESELESASASASEWELPSLS